MAFHIPSLYNQSIHWNGSSATCILWPPFEMMSEIVYKTRSIFDLGQSGVGEQQRNLLFIKDNLSQATIKTLKE